MRQTDEVPRLTLVRPRHTHERRARTAVAASFLAVVVVVFVQSFAVPYFLMEDHRFGIFKPRRDWLIAHIAGGTVAILVGPAQLWLGTQRRNAILHRLLGILYVIGVGTGTTAAFYLAWKTDFGWIFGTGMTALAVAWTLTTFLAVAAICREILQQHREWMIRSYVVTFAFVNFRILAEVFAIAQIGTIKEQLSAASWLCWSVPLLVTEAVLQGRKIFSPAD